MNSPTKTDLPHDVSSRSEVAQLMLEAAYHMVGDLPEDQLSTAAGNLFEEVASNYEDRGVALPAWLVELRGVTSARRRGFVLRDIEDVCMGEIVRTPVRFLAKHHPRKGPGIAAAVGLPWRKLRRFLGGGSLKREDGERLEEWLLGQAPGQEVMATHLNFGLAFIASTVPPPLREEARVGVAEYLAGLLAERGYPRGKPLLREVDWPNLVAAPTEIWFP